MSEAVKEKKGKVILIANQKGGVGKTTLTRNIAAGLYGRGYSVLMIDFDTQGHLGIISNVKDVLVLPKEKTIVHPFECAVKREPITYPIINLNSSSSGRLDMIPANKTLAGLTEILNKFPSNISLTVMDKLLQPLRKRYDFIVIDSGPTVTERTYVSIAAADECLIANTPENLSAESIVPTLSSILWVSEQTHKPIRVSAAINKVAKRKVKLYEFGIKKIEKICEENNIHLYKTHIPDTKDVGEAMLQGKTIPEYAHKNEDLFNSIIGLTSEIIEYNK